MYTIEELAVGQSASWGKTITETDVTLYAGVSGDMNPVHINEEYAKGTPFGRRIAHGMLTIGFVSAILGRDLPGEGTIYMGQTVKFLAPVFIGDTITAHVEVTEIDKEKRRVKLHTYCTNQAGETVLDGEATVRPPQKPE